MFAMSLLEAIYRNVDYFHRIWGYVLSFRKLGFICFSICYYKER